jgi:hypothetical protein
MSERPKQPPITFVHGHQPAKEIPAVDAAQVGGKHYKGGDNAYQHWNVAAALGWDYFTGQITKYLWRWRLKGGLDDLRKAQHYLLKYIEVEEAKERAVLEDSEPTQGYVDQDR